LPSALGINTVLARGENLRSITVRQDFKQLHSEIRAVSQVAGTDTSWGNAPVATVTEPKVKRFRPITVVTEQATDATKLVSRANAERNIRMGNARRVVVDVVGWRIKPSLPLWPIARSVVVRDEEFNLYDERLVISTVTYRKNHQDGEVTTLEMVPRAALNQLYKSENKSEVW
jgi:prophage tail gpP-like protein